MKNLKYIITIAAFFSLNQCLAQSKINAVVKAYVSIKNALAADDSKTANLKAKQFTAALKAIVPADLNTKQKSVWIGYAEKLRYDGDHISESTAIAHQREHFGNLSKNMIEVIKSLQPTDATYYKQYCPMEKKFWLSETPDVKNPFYGKEMPDCGETKETIKPAVVK